MKTIITHEFTEMDKFDEEKLTRILKADKAYYALYKIKSLMRHEICQKQDKKECEILDNISMQIALIIVDAGIDLDNEYS